MTWGNFAPFFQKRFFFSGEMNLFLPFPQVGEPGSGWRGLRGGVKPGCVAARGG